jgi:hypothetical protein
MLRASDVLIMAGAVAGIILLRRYRGLGDNGFDTYALYDEPMLERDRKRVNEAVGQYDQALRKERALRVQVIDAYRQYRPSEMHPNDEIAQRRKMNELMSRIWRSERQRENIAREVQQRQQAFRNRGMSILKRAGQKGLSRSQQQELQDKIQKMGAIIPVAGV